MLSDCLFSGNIETEQRFGPAFSKRYVALAGLLIGIGEITGQVWLPGGMDLSVLTRTFLGGLLFGMLGKQVVRRGRDPVIALGLVTHIVFFGVTFLNMPSNSPYEVAIDLFETPYVLKFGPRYESSVLCAVVVVESDCVPMSVVSMLP